MCTALGEEVGGGGDCPVGAADEFSALQAGEEAVHAFGEFGDVLRDRGVDCAEGEGEFGEGAEAGGEGCCEGEEVVGWLVLLGGGGG